jgi:uncharacterized protein YccT (UPF0319 family)
MTEMTDYNVDDARAAIRAIEAITQQQGRSDMNAAQLLGCLRGRVDAADERAKPEPEAPTEPKPEAHTE